MTRLLNRGIAVAMWRLLANRRSFRAFQALGVHITPNDYYQPVPDTRELPASLWAGVSELPGIDMNEAGQMGLLSVFASNFRAEYDAFEQGKSLVPHKFYLNNGWFGSVDAEVLYCIVRHFKPSRIYEIGSGFSTLLSAEAASKNTEEDSDYRCELVAIEPYPSQMLKQGFPGLTRLITEKVQNIPLAEFGALRENDILFIDSSHVLKIGSDVQYEYLEVLPRLSKGVIVHSHDIFLPAEYPREWVFRDHKFWTEQYLLQAFLAFNSSFGVLWAGSWMHLNHPGQLEQAFKSYSRATSRPGSFWMRKK